ncbi:hypothetical protein GCM10007423_02910 [Dyadobacter endophyticus]|uniref:Uncharacterized protein n=1 Tax=Dyadobacter endophyticus TaxID=1749036 RepID=A0ABQ1YD26_9BACT|nr:hypothetical protein GCM10007423_02910 [Dyadobacter endophyticus]
MHKCIFFPDWDSAIAILAKIRSQSPFMWPAVTQMDYAGLFAAELGFLADINILAQLPDVAAVNIEAEPGRMAAQT